MPLAAQATPGSPPRFQDGTINMQELVRQLAESIANEVMSAGAVMCEQDEAWPGCRCFSEAKISELYEERPAPKAPDERRREEPRLVAKKAIEASLELADTMEAA